MPLTLSPAMADRFSRIIALLYEIVADQGVLRLRNGPLTILIYNRIRRWAGRFLARATVPPRRGETTPRAPRAPAAPRPPPGVSQGMSQGINQETSRGIGVGGTGVLPDAPHLPRGRGWLVKLMQPTAFSQSQLMALLSEPEVTALLLARPQLARLLRPLCHALSMPPMPWFPPVRRRPPEPGPANPGAGTAAAPAGPAPGAKPPGRRDQRPLPWHRNADLAYRLPIAPPLPGS